eukprot:GHVR01034629.1.p1 GENE.GHVR01034629.1~~GHVR01034629.1.p1  ORF type:complete len:638 (+),score=117.05 GHVR01034629.1:56-1969(+)
MTSNLKLKEHQLLTRIFCVSLHPKESASGEKDIQLIEQRWRNSYTYLKNLSVELEESGQELILTIDMMEAAVMARLALPPGDGKSQLRWLCECHHRATDEGDVFLTTLPPPLRECLGRLSDLITDHAALYIQCPELFNLPPSIDVTQLLLGTFESGMMQPRFYERFVGQLERNQEGDVARLFTPLIRLVVGKLRGRTICDPANVTCRTLTFLLSIKNIASLVALTDCFLPSTPPLFSRSLPGYTLMTASILGHALTPSCILSELHDPSHSVRQKYFNDLNRKTRPQIESAVSSLRAEVNNSIDFATQIVNPILRSGDAPREKVLLWLSQVVVSQEGRAKLSNMFSVDSAAVMPGMMQLILQGTGEVTTAFAFNVFSLMLKLVEPIKTSKVLDLDYFWCHRSDCKRLRGLHTRAVKDTICMGDKEELDTALKYFQGTGSESQPVKFPSHIYWLALRGLRVLFSPTISAYESHWRKISAQTHTLGRNSPEYLKLVGETLCYDVHLFCPSFLSSLGHMIDLFVYHMLSSIFLFTSDGSDDLNNRNILINKNGRVASLVHLLFPLVQQPTRLPPQFICLPEDTVVSVFECVTHQLLMTDKSTLPTLIDIDAITALSLTVLSPNLVRSPHTRFTLARLQYGY